MHYGAKESSPRKLVWVTERKSAAWGCSECAWFFLPIPIAVNSFELLTMHLQEELEKEFASHDCTQHPATSMDRAVQILRKTPQP
jgi:hypothetical protein